MARQEGDMLPIKEYTSEFVMDAGSIQYTRHGG
jgi:hypothetical protein